MKMNVKLTPVAGKRGVFEGTVSGEKIVIAWGVRVRANEKDLNGSVTFPADRINAAKAHAKTANLECWVACEVFLKSDRRFGWAVTMDDFIDKYRGGNHLAERMEFPVNESAREKYEASST